MRGTRKVLMNLLAVISVVLFAVLVATTTWQVVSRQLLDDPSTWSEELAKLLFVWLAFFGSSFLFGERGHIAVDFLARRLPAVGQRIAQLFVQVIILAFAILGMIWGGILATSIAWEQSMTALPLNIGWVYTVIPIAGVFISIFAIMDIIGLATGATEPYPEVEDPDGEIEELPAVETTAVAAADAASTDPKEPAAPKEENR